MPQQLKASKLRTTTIVMRAIAAVALLALVASACSSSGSDGDDPAGEGPDESSSDEAPARGDSESVTIEPGPLTVRLSNGQAFEQTQTLLNVVEGDPLDEDEIAAVLDRVPEWTPSQDLGTPFKRPAETLNPPRVTQLIETAFPPPTDVDVPAVDSGPLEVLRFQPDGEVAVAPFLSLTFNQPMVALTTLTQLDQADVPVEMTPALDGRWQWIGTKTLRFEADPDERDRLPMATTFSVTVPAGTKSAAGAELAEAFTFGFETPAPAVQYVHPSMSESMATDQLFFVQFNQEVDPQTALDAVKVLAEDDEKSVRIATDDEIGADEDVERLLADASDGTWMVLRADEPLPTNAAIRLEVGPNVPSAEGPNTSDAVSVTEGRTYAPLTIERQGCGEGFPCVPSSWISVDFNNVLDAEAFSPEQVTIEPAIVGQRIEVFGGSVSINGATVGETMYSITLSGDLLDEFGQTLGDDQTVEVQVEKATPELSGPTGQLVTLDPFAEKPALSISTMNHSELRVRVYRVSQEDWPAFQRYAESLWREDQTLSPPGTSTSDRTVTTDAPANQRTETEIPLDEALTNGLGQLVVVVEPVGDLANLSPDDGLYWQNRPVAVWAQATNIGLDTSADHDSMTVWATDLTSGEPLSGTQIKLGAATGVTDADGFAQMALPSDVNGNQRPLLSATAGEDVAFLDGYWRSYDISDTMLFHIIDDKGIHKPGETMKVKGWLRARSDRTDGQLSLVPADTTVRLAAFDAAGNEIYSGESAITAQGGFTADVAIPAGANLGDSWMTVNATTSDGRDGYGEYRFRIDEFRRPEFEVTARTESPGPYLTGVPATVAVDASYYAGGATPNAPVDWLVATRDTTYAPPGWSEYSFGKWTPWWEDRGFSQWDDCYDCGGFGGDEATYEELSGTTNSQGTHYLEMAFGGDGEGYPTTVSAQATVTDVNRQAWSSTTDLLVHPALLYVGLRGEATFVRMGDPLVIDAVVTDIDGELSDEVPTMTASRLINSFSNGEWVEEAIDPQTCDPVAHEDGVRCQFTTDVGGTYRIEATITDEAGRTSRSLLTRWVSGNQAKAQERVEGETLVLVPDLEEYAPGDTAEILVQSPFGPGYGQLTVAANGIESTTTFRIEEDATVIEVPISDDPATSRHLAIEVVGAAARTSEETGAARRPAFAVGRLELAVPANGQMLDVSVTPETPELTPGETTSIAVEIKDPDGQAVEGAEFAAVVVDEAILALTDYSWGDPLASFFTSSNTYIDTIYGRQSILLTQLPASNTGQENAVPTTTSPAIGGDGDLSSAEGAADDAAAPLSARSAAYNLAEQDSGPGGLDISVRSDFDPVAAFVPSGITDADGKAQIDIDLPDNLTRYRVMVVAVDGASHFGSGEANLTARLPLMVRPSAPRFLNYGDEFELPIVVQNQTAAEVSVDVVIEAANLELPDGPGKRVVVAPNDRVEVRFDARTADAGTAEFRAIATTADEGDAAIVSLPVYTPSTSESFAVYGTIDDGAVVQPLEAPTGVISEFGGLEVSTSSTAVSALTDAVIYLAEYEYTSPDALSSRIIGVGALRDVLDAFDAEGLPDAADLEAQLTSDIEGLVALQNSDGGFSYWRRGQASQPMPTIYGVHALVSAREAGFTVSNDAISRGLDRLSRIEELFDQDYSPATRAAMQAYALYVRDRAGVSDSSEAASLYRSATDDLSVEALAWLWPVITDESIRTEILRTLNNRATETAGAATFTTDYGDEGYLILSSNRRTDGIVLGALVTEAPDSDLLPKVVAGLLGNQTNGRWRNAQENTFILQALHDYFVTFENVTPDFVARLWLGDDYMAERSFEGRSTDTSTTNIPMAELQAGGDEDIVLAKDGAGRLYYRLGLRSAPDDLRLDPLDRGFVVSRTYEAVGHASDVSQDADGTWHIKAGASVRVKLAMVADSRRTMMALVDALPAGFEPQNTDLAVVGETIPVDGEESFDDFEGDFGRSISLYNYGGWWGRDWFEHQNLRDDRVEAFSTYLPAGTYDYSYVVRATTPGTFVTPPARAEEIFAPETFGRTATDIVVIEERLGG